MQPLYCARRACVTAARRWADIKAHADDPLRLEDSLAWLWRSVLLQRCTPSCLDPSVLAARLYIRAGRDGEMSVEYWVTRMQESYGNRSPLTDKERLGGTTPPRSSE